MSVRFTRAFRNLARCFPGAGSWQGPSVASDGVLFTEGIFRASICHDLRFRLDVQSAATAGAPTVLTHPEPPVGYIHVPILWGVTYSGVAGTVVEAQVQRTASAFDSWGGWGVGTVAGIGTYEIVINSTVLVQAFPYMRGIQLLASFGAPAAATNVSSQLWFVEMPMELATIETWKAMPGNFQWTRAIP